eukprot:CAMPEP_0174840950 /NCGR_PEP_ID=MMETSP1114-20130205/9003_1 /TAXON_ID=312471 /ORGANISM="Neobodo designis, Strain CCAP 1951/1" /LENGTH=192 /DNA_ID=CAMNT_0016075119 /DNA_START=241 /DNA_END=819 /DNA_ORIENTATION=+
MSHYYHPQHAAAHAYGQHGGAHAQQQHYVNDVFALPEAMRHERERRLRSLAQEGVVYSDRYEDDAFEYRHVILPKAMLNCGVPVTRYLTEEEWHSIGVTQSPGWVQFLTHTAEPNVLIFRRPLSEQRRAAKAAEHAALEERRAHALQLVQARREARAQRRLQSAGDANAVPAKPSVAASVAHTAPCTSPAYA